MKMLLRLVPFISLPVMAQDDGSVRQPWEASKDGKSWTILFDRLYEKVPAN